jgi:tRNA1(Val) A37 N6-methylase TrmN6
MSFVPRQTDTPPLEVTDDAVLGGRLKLKQPVRGHRVGHDAILLAAAVPAATGELAVDLGAGVGAAGLALAARVPGSRIALVELDAELSALAAENIRRNGFAARARALTLDVVGSLEAFSDTGLTSGIADHVLMNPPFNDPARYQVSPNTGRRRAHTASPVLLHHWIATARRLLRPSGTLTLIWRAEGLAQVLAGLEKGFGGIVVLAVHPDAAKPAIRVIVRAVKESRAPLRLLSPLLLADQTGNPSVAANAVLRDAAALAQFE